MKRLWILGAVLAALAIFAIGEKESVRPPAVAGKFYPADPKELYDQIDRLIRSSPVLGFRGVRAILVPHAGYPFSAPVAATSFREVTSDFRRVFLLASNHRGDIDFSGVSLPDETQYAVPGATIPISPVVKELKGQPGFVDLPAAHTMHMIEVELPFLHYLKKEGSSGFEIVPMILGRMDPAAIERLAGALNRYVDDQTLFVFSVDLSHYFPDQEARRLDTFTLRAIMARDSGALSRATTDGDQVLLTMARLADLREWEPTLLMYRNSGDSSGDRSRVVGYGAVVYHAPLSLTDEEKGELLTAARKGLETAVRDGEKAVDDLPKDPQHPILNVPRGVFITLKKKGALRGCIGSLFPGQPLYQGVLKNASLAALHDKRFLPVTPAELGEISVSISLLDYPRRIEAERPEEFAKRIIPREDGVILMHEEKQSTFLPAVWDQIPDPEAFLSQLCLKQDSPAGCWKEKGTELYRYRASEFSEGSR